MERAGDEFVDQKKKVRRKVESSALLFVLTCYEQKRLPYLVHSPFNVTEFRNEEGQMYQISVRIVDASIQVL